MQQRLVDQNHPISSKHSTRHLNQVQADFAANPLSVTAHTWLAPVHTEICQAVEQRVIRQLIQTMLYENMLDYQLSDYASDVDDTSELKCIHHSSITAVSTEQNIRTEQNTRTEQQRAGSSSIQKQLFKIENPQLKNNHIHYECVGTIFHSFDLIRLDRNYHVVRVENQQRSYAQLNVVLEEIVAQIQDPQYLDLFVQEIIQTYVNDTQARSVHHGKILSEHDLTFDALESNLIDAHSYHPCYKSRIGFNLKDNFEFGPEFQQSIHLVWIAIRKSHRVFNTSSDIDYEQFIEQQLGSVQLEHFQQSLEQLGHSFDDYTLCPVHPWQWDNQICSLFMHDIAAQNMIYLGLSPTNYKAQQSIRTLSNFSNPNLPYIKLSLGITNTSSKRTLSKHTVLNAPLISDWLYQLRNSNHVAQQLNFVILRETVGLSYQDDHLPKQLQKPAYGALSSIWRESIHPYLRAQESAFPMNGLSFLQANNEPLIAVWIERYGLETWLKQLLQVMTLPVMHMLFAEGIGMESHAQNMILIHEDGWPTRIALKDFHDGVRFVPALLTHPELQPDLVAMPEHHAKKNDNSHVITIDPHAVRDISCDCFFFICLADLAIFLKQHYQFSEQQFWKIVAICIADYQTQYPEHQRRYQLFDVFCPSIQVEELTKRRLLGDAQPRLKHVPNPLAEFAYLSPIHAHIQPQSDF